MMTTGQEYHEKGKARLILSESVQKLSVKTESATTINAKAVAKVRSTPKKPGALEPIFLSMLCTGIQDRRKRCIDDAYGAIDLLLCDRQRWRQAETVAHAADGMHNKH